MPTAYNYTRLSTPDQLKGDGLRRQLERPQLWIDQHPELGLVLDTTLNLRDLGVSAYRGDNATSGALGAFIAAVDSGHVAPGSYLLVESLDRLSRADVLTIALPQFTSLVGKEIIIVTLLDNKIYSKESIKNNPLDLIMSILIMIRAKEESDTKADRVGKAWEKKRSRAITSNHKLTHNCPGWLQLNDEHDRFTVIPDRVQLVQRIYQMSLDGYGELAITKQLNKERIPTWRKSNGWQLSFGATIVAEFVEVETGTGKADRPKLAQAIARTRAVRGKLVVAKIDRLACNVAFTSALMDSGCDFIACDNPHATRLTIHILAAVAEDEARQISERTTAALAAAKRRGVALGTHRVGHTINYLKGAQNGLPKAREAVVAMRAQARADCYGYLLLDIQAWRSEGESFAAIATRLNTAGHVTTGGRAFAPMTVVRILL